MGACAELERAQSDLDALYNSYSAYGNVGVADINDLQELVKEPEDEAPRPRNVNPLGRSSRAQQPEQSGGAGQGPLIEPEGTLLQDEEGNKFRVVGGKYVREQ